MDDGGHRQGMDLTPLMIGLLGIMAGMVVVATYHCVVSNCFKRSRSVLPDAERGEPRMVRQHIRTGPAGEIPMPANGTITDSPVQPPSTGSSSLIFKYQNEYGEGTCAVCLGEFGEGEKVRVIPECAHSFHVECIDMWLFSHSNCPLCRAKTSLSRNLNYALSAPQHAGGLAATQSHGGAHYGG